MSNHDPFERLGFDCKELVLDYLRPDDLVRCEGVSKFWQHIARTRMAKDGSRLDSITSPASTEEFIRRFKHAAARRANLRHGRASSVRRFTTDSSVFYRPSPFRIAGNFVAWKSLDALLWGTLLFNDDGSVQPPREIDMAGVSCYSHSTSGREVPSLMVNADGYMFLRTMQNYPGRLLSDRVSCLSTGEVIWQQDLPEPPRFHDPPLLPLCIGKSRIYYTRTDLTPHKLVAYDFKNDEKLYDEPVDSQKGTLRDWYDSLELFVQGSEEFLLHITGSSNRSIATLYSGATGKVSEKYEYTGLSFVRLLAYSSSDGFALMASPPAGDSKLILLFTRSHDGRFAHTGTEAVSIESGRVKLDEIDIDPFRLLMVSFSATRPIPKIWTLINCTDESMFQEINEQLLDTNLPHGIVDRLWEPTEPHEVDLPPAPRGKKRRILRFNRSTTGSNARFVDGQRLSVDIRGSERNDIIMAFGLVMGDSDPRNDLHVYEVQTSGSPESPWGWHRLDFGIPSIHFKNGTTRPLAVINGTAEYRAAMQIMVEQGTDVNEISWPLYIQGQQSSPASSNSWTWWMPNIWGSQAAEAISIPDHLTAIGAMLATLKSSVLDQLDPPLEYNKVALSLPDILGMNWQYRERFRIPCDLANLEMFGSLITRKTNRYGMIIPDRPVHQSTRLGADSVDEIGGYWDEVRKLLADTIGDAPVDYIQLIGSHAYDSGLVQALQDVIVSRDNINPAVLGRYMQGNASEQDRQDALFTSANHAAIGARYGMLTGFYECDMMPRDCPVDDDKQFVWDDDRWIFMGVSDYLD
ncbi:hypothetical protein FE257_000200 [Aspergillus nanangensis]|uniref:F-box domain-containing protein n=1 Tax=Aspergillus nanangensis TaxID=2582783 RepID=A0AAD4CZE5_ASPNN|nr:hypothetical protein FE257_000200 [Aspergillus nanangensis]